jgi:hypothetical protein
MNLVRRRRTTAKNTAEQMLAPCRIPCRVIDVAEAEPY